MTKDQIGRILAVYYSNVSALELLNNYCEKLLFSNKKEFHSSNEKYYYNNLHATLKKAKHWFEMYQKENYKLDASITDEKGNIIKHATEFDLADHSLISGIVYNRFLFLLYNVIANGGDELTDTFIELEKKLRELIEKDYIPEEAISQFKVIR